MPMVPSEMSLNDEVLAKLPLERKLNASQAPSDCLPHNIAEPVEGTLSHEVVPAERTLKDEASHALALGSISSAQHRATLPPREWQSASTCAYRSSISNDGKCPSMHRPILWTDRSTASSRRPRSKDSLGSPSHSCNNDRRSRLQSCPRPPSIRTGSLTIAADERFAVAHLRVANATIVARPRRRPQSHKQYFQDRTRKALSGHATVLPTKVLKPPQVLLL